MLSMRLKQIKLTFENCESMTIEGKYIGSFHIGDIREEISRTASNSIDILQVPYQVVMEIHKDADQPYFPFGLHNSKSGPMTAFDRILAWNDIAQIEVELCDEGTYYGVYSGDEKKMIRRKFYPHWTFDPCSDGCINPAQKNMRSSFGNLYLVIDDKAKLDDYFSYEEIQNEGFELISSEMLGIGDKEYEFERERYLESLPRENITDTEAEDPFE